MKKMNEILIAGFGGQGVLFSGRVLACAGLLADKEVSWMPSYGPEMRGGTCNCSVIISDDKIGSPIILNADILIALNLPSILKFEKFVKPGGLIFLDSAIADKKIERTDTKNYYIPAARLADENGVAGLANMIMAGKVIKETGVSDISFIRAAMEQAVPDRKKDLLEANLKAIDIGYNYM